jgi:hypothetical protein
LYIRCTGHPQYRIRKQGHGVKALVDRSGGLVESQCPEFGLLGWDFVTTFFPDDDGELGVLYTRSDLESEEITLQRDAIA